MAEASMHTSTIMLQQLSDWELHVLVLLSFALQIFLFFSGGLRRRNNHMLLRITIWISYMSADFIAAYTLGRLSRSWPTTEEKHKLVTHELTILWAPFLLIHLGGQDTVTAFSLEDNELWLRHLLNLVGQACLVVYVLWKWVALAQYQVVIPAAFLFVAGIIKYGERIWALKLGSQKGLRTSTSRDVMKESLEEVEIFSCSRRGYEEIIQHALQTEQCVRYLFAGKKLDMLSPVSGKFLYYEDGGDAKVSFKRVEIELSIMYDSLFTKSRVIQTRPGSILRCISIASTVVAFVLYVVKMINFDYHTRRSRVDASITYILFIGAFCLEAFSIFVVMMSPWQWPVLEAGRCCRRVAWLWPIFTRIHPETKPWWSNSMGQYNLIASRRSVDSKWSSTLVMAKMAGVFGAREWWNKISNTKHAPVTREIKELINDSIGYGCIPVPSPYGLLFKVPFEEALVSLHLWTDVVMHKVAEAAAATQRRDQEAAAAAQGRDQEAAAAAQGRDQEAAAATQGQDQEAAVRRRIKTLSNYMLYLLVEHPAMLPGRTNIQDLMERSFLRVINGASDKADKEEGILESLAKGYGGPGWDFWRNQKKELEEEGGIHKELVILEQVWVRMLLYAAAKCRPDEHARPLSTGVELITFVWLLMAHHSLGDVDTIVNLTTTTGDSTSTNTAAVYLMDPLPPSAGQ